MLTNTICFINQKGGCGKSSSCFHLAGHFATRGLRVLAIDADPQGSLSQGFFGSAAIETLPPRETLAAVFAEDEVASPELLVAPTQFERVSVNACGDDAPDTALRGPPRGAKPSGTPRCKNACTNVHTEA